MNLGSRIDSVERENKKPVSCVSIAAT